MNQKIFNSGIGVLVFGIILLIIGNVSYSDFFYETFGSTIFFNIGAILNLLGMLLFIAGIIFIVVGAFMKEDFTYGTASSQSQSPQNQSIYCTNCGAKLPSDSIFCNKCGKKV